MARSRQPQFVCQKVLQRESAPDRYHMLWYVCAVKEATGQDFCRNINKSNRLNASVSLKTDTHLNLKERKKKRLRLLSFCLLSLLMCVSTKTEPREISPTKTKLFKRIVLPAAGERGRERLLNGSGCVLPVQRYSWAERPGAQQDAHRCWNRENNGHRSKKKKKDGGKWGGGDGMS